MDESPAAVVSVTPSSAAIPPGPQVALTVTPTPSSETQTPPSPVKPSGNPLIKLLIVLIILAALAWVGNILWRYFSGNLGVLKGPSSQSAVIKPPTATPTATLTDPYADWQAAQVLNGFTRVPISEISFRLPPSVDPLACDNAGCYSQGTSLPGGTRFTVAARGAEQQLRDFRGAIITDLNGRAFETKTTTIAGRPATEFTGTFNGITAGGFNFSQMHGYMIELTDKLSLEVNHFSPQNAATDFAADETLLQQILGSFVFNFPSPGEKGAVILLTSPTPSSSSSPLATPSISLTR